MAAKMRFLSSIEGGTKIDRIRNENMQVNLKSNTNTCTCFKNE
jgi:hypothetical protein